MHVGGGGGGGDTAVYHTPGRRAICRVGRCSHAKRSILVFLVVRSVCVSHNYRHSTQHRPRPKSSSTDAMIIIITIIVATTAFG